MNNPKLKQAVKLLEQADEGMLKLMRSTGDKLNQVQMVLFDYDMTGNAEEAIKKIKEAIGYETNNEG